MLRTLSLVLLVSSVGLASSFEAQEQLGTFMQPRESTRWLGGMGVPGVGLSGGVHAWATFDDGSGPAVYAAGWFYAAGEHPVNGVARWNGSEWEPVGGGIGLTFAQEIRALAVYDDGSGPALYAAGQFDKIDGKNAKGFARWKGDGWEVLPGQVGFGFNALVVADIGQGPQLYAGGEFIRAGGVNADNFARWDGSWRPVGTGIPLRTCNALAIHDDGGGPALFAGMEFTNGESSLRRFDTTSGWSEVAGTPAMQINALQVFDDGSGARLAIGGYYLAPSAAYAYDGATFAPLGTLSQTVEDLDVLPGGGGTDVLVVGGSLFSAGHVATWDGSAWQPLAGGANSSVQSLGVLDVGAGPGVYISGVSQAGTKTVHGVAMWDGADWSALAGAQFGMDSSVNGFLEFDDGTGNALYAYGDFESSGLTKAFGLAEWNGTSWDEVGGGLQWTLGTVNGLPLDAITFQTGDGPVLVVVGAFTRAGTTNVQNIARWNGSNWASLGTGILASYGSVRTVEAYQSLLYVGGSFSALGGQPGTRITAWNGVTQTWSAVGDLTNTTFSSQAGPRDLTAFDLDGNGELLYVGGDIDFANGILVENLARWDGTSWSAVPFGGLTADDAQTNALVTDCIAVDVPALGGKALIVRGTFDNAGTLAADGMAWLSASGWSSPAGFAADTIQAIGQVGSRLYAIDRLVGVVRWNGVDWVPLGGGALGNRPSTSSWAFGNALYRYDDGSGPKLFVGGSFDSAGPLVSTDVARLVLGGPRLAPQPHNQ